MTFGKIPVFFKPLSLIKAFLYQKSTPKKEEERKE
jgi:hypothetical protein